MPRNSLFSTNVSGVGGIVLVVPRERRSEGGVVEMRERIYELPRAC